MRLELSWDNFNESGDFQAQIERYRQRFGYYPESVHVVRIYRTRANRAFCKERGIRLSAPPLGRPPLEPKPESVRQQRQDEKLPNAIEGKFGQAKRRFSLGRIMSKLSGTAETSIAITFLVMNLQLLLRQFFCFIFLLWSAVCLLKKFCLGCFRVTKTTDYLLVLASSFSV